LTNRNECTLLYISAQFVHLDATKTLAERGAALNYTNRNGYTPLMVAANNDNFEILCYLTDMS